MAKWDNINGIIENAIKSNNAQSITGDSLQSVLKSIVSDVGANATFAGIAIASTSPGSYDGPVFYIAASAGTYAGFGSIVVNAGELAVLYNSANGNGWSKSSIGLSSITDKSITKAKLASDVPIDAMQNKITQLETAVNTVVGEGATEAIENFAEILAFLNGITDTTTLEGLLTNLRAEINGELFNKVDKISGKGLSTNDYTTAEKNKLAGIAEGAQVNTVTGVKGNTEASYRTGNVNITPANIGAAAASHTHSADDITSGTLSVDRIAGGSITKDKLAEGVLDSDILISAIYIDQTITDPASMISGDINGAAIQAIRANSHRYLGKYTADNTMTICQLLDRNSNFYHDGSVADLTGAQGDVFMRLPLFYTKAKELSADFWQIQFAFGGQPDDDGWMQWGGNDLIGVYEAYHINSKLYSRSGVTPSVSISQADFKTYARNRGIGFTIEKLKHQNIMAFLFYALYGNTNAQAICGYGTEYYPKTAGVTNSLGMTDTTTSNGNSMSINFWGLENWWGDTYEWIDNVVQGDGVCIITEDDGSTRTQTIISSANSYISKILIGKHLDTIPSLLGASATSGFCDNYYSSPNIDCIWTRSAVGVDPRGGMICASFANAPTLISDEVGSRLAFLGNVIEEKDVEKFKSLTAIG